MEKQTKLKIVVGGAKSRKKFGIFVVAAVFAVSAMVYLIVKTGVKDESTVQKSGAILEAPKLTEEQINKNKQKAYDEAISKSKEQGLSSYQQAENLAKAAFVSAVDKKAEAKDLAKQAIDLFGEEGMKKLLFNDRTGHDKLRLIAEGKY